MSELAHALGLDFVTAEGWLLVIASAVGLVLVAISIARRMISKRSLPTGPGARGSGRPTPPQHLVH